MKIVFKIKFMFSKIILSISLVVVLGSRLRPPDLHDKRPGDQFRCDG